jgi:hypothetical protein
VLLHLQWPLVIVDVLCAVLLSLHVPVSRYNCTAWAYLAVDPVRQLDFTGRFGFFEHHSGLEAGRCLQSILLHLLLLLLLLLLNVLPRVKHSGINTVDQLILVACVASASKQSKIVVG